MQKEENSSSSQATVVVIGENCKDKFIYGRCDRICPEAPVPVFKPTGDVTINDGMAGNVASNVRSLGMPCHHIKNPCSITKTRYIDYKTNQMITRVDEDDYADKIVLEGINTPLIASADLVIVSDYDKGFLDEQSLERIFALNPNCFLDTKKRLKATWAYKAKFIKINEPEFNSTKDTMGKGLLKKTIVTKGESGCNYRDINYPAPGKLQTIDVSGAGDTFLAALAVKWLETGDIKKAIPFANECAHKVIQQRGVTTVDLF